MLHLIVKQLQDLDLLGKVHTSGLLMRHRTNEELARTLNRSTESKLSATNVAVANAAVAAATKSQRAEDVARKLHSIAESKLAQTNTELAQTKATVATRAQAAETLFRSINTPVFLMQEGLMGRVALEVLPKVVEISRSLLNAAEAGEVVNPVVARLVHPPTNQQHAWIRGEQVRITLTPTIADEDVPAPSATDPVEIVNGNCQSDLTWGTGAGEYAAGVAATGEIVCLAAADLFDGETVTVKDATGLQRVFEFDNSGVHTGFNIVVPLAEGATATQMATALRAAILASGLAVSVVQTTDTLALTQNFVGDIGNQAITETVLDSDFTVTGFTGGSADKIVVELAVESHDGAADNKLPFGNFEVTPVTQTFVVR